MKFKAINIQRVQVSSTQAELVCVLAVLSQISPAYWHNLLFPPNREVDNGEFFCFAGGAKLVHCNGKWYISGYDPHGHDVARAQHEMRYFYLHQRPDIQFC